MRDNLIFFSCLVWPVHYVWRKILKVYRRIKAGQHMRADVEGRSVALRKRVLSPQLPTPPNAALDTILGIEPGPAWPDATIKLAIIARYACGVADEAKAKALKCALTELGWFVIDVLALDINDDQGAPNETAALVKARDMSESWTIKRRNIGHDFGSWRTGLDWVRQIQVLDRCSQLLLVNDSIFNLETCIGDILGRFDPSVDVMGVTESVEILPHLQSYLMAFSQRAITSKAFEDFWHSYGLDGDRQNAVLNGELRLSAMMDGSKLKRASLVPYRKVERAFVDRCKREGTVEIGPNDADPLTRSNVLFAINSKVPLSPICMFWLEIIEDFSIPIAKKSLLNPNQTLLANAGSIIPALLKYQRQLLGEPPSV